MKRMISSYKAFLLTGWIILTIGTLPQQMRGQDLTISTIDSITNSVLVCSDGSLTLTVDGFEPAPNSIVWQWDSTGSFDTIPQSLLIGPINSSTDTITFHTIDLAWDSIQIKVYEYDSQDIVIDSSDLFLLQVADSPQAFNSLVVLEGDNEYCPVNQDSLTLKASGGSTENYDTIFWYKDNFTGIPIDTETLEIKVAAVGTYFVRREGCALGPARSQVVIEERTDSLTDATSLDGSTVCPGTTVYIVASGGNTDSANEIIVWYDDDGPGGDSIGVGDTLQIVVNSDTTVYVRREGCQDTDFVSATIEVVEAPPAPMESEIIRSQGDPLCKGERDTLTVTTPLFDPQSVFEWFDSNPPSPSPLFTGEQFITPTDLPTGITTYYIRQVNRCGIPSALDSIDIEVIPGPSSEFTSTFPDRTCIDEVISFEVIAVAGSTPGTYEWNFGPTASPASASGLGPHAVTFSEEGLPTISVLSEGQGCSSTNERILEVLNLPEAELDTIPDAVCVGQIFSIEGRGVTGSTTDSYEWNLGPSATPTSVDGLGPHAIVYNEVGPQTLQLTSLNEACSTDLEAEVMVVNAPRLLINGEAPASSYSVQDGQVFEYAFTSEFGSPDITWSWQVTSGSLEGSNADTGMGGTFSDIWTVDEGETSATIEVNISLMGVCDSTYLIILTLESEQSFFIPNLLTPNGDSFNDTWEINLGNAGANADDYPIKLYNRQGMCVCGCDESFTIETAKTWDGGGLPAGAYWYIIEGPDGFLEKGSLSILK